jgi:hypothetical protein
MDDFPNPVRRHPAAHNAANVALIVVDQLGEPLGLTLFDLADKLHLLARRPAKGYRVIGHRQMNSRDPSVSQNGGEAHDTTVKDPSERVRFTRPA